MFIMICIVASRERHLQLRSFMKVINEGEKQQEQKKKSNANENCGNGVIFGEGQN
jgi:hypothetical protein